MAGVGPSIAGVRGLKTLFVWGPGFLGYEIYNIYTCIYGPPYPKVRGTGVVFAWIPAREPVKQAGIADLCSGGLEVAEEDPDRYNFG